MSARIGDSGLPTLTSPAGKKISKLFAGKYTLVIKDTSTHHGFHLIGPGVNKSTGIARKGTFTWKLTLRHGTYTYRDDAKPAAKKAFKVVSRPPL